MGLCIFVVGSTFPFLLNLQKEVYLMRMLQGSAYICFSFCKKGRKKKKRIKEIQPGTATVTIDDGRQRMVQ